MKKYSTRKALLMSVLSLFLCLTMFAGTTYAWFTDSVSSANNKIVAGSLDIAFEKYNETTKSWEDASNKPVFDYALWEPGYTQIVNLRVVNQGTLALKWKAVLTAEKAISALADVINVYVRSDDRADTVREYVSKVGRFDFEAEAAAGNFKKFTLRQFIENLTAMTTGELVAGQESYLGIVLQMDTSAGNEYQGLDVGGKMDLTILATQLSYEKDSFGDEYDVAAPFPIVAFDTMKVEAGKSFYELSLTGADGSKVGYVDVKAASLAEDATDVAIKVFETGKLHEGVTVTADQDARTFEIKAYGLDPANDTPVKVSLTIGNGLSNVALYHYDEKVSNAVYNEYEGNIVFETCTFSPFTVVYDAPGIEVDDTPADPDAPKAIVSDLPKYENRNLDWKAFGFPALPNGYQLESVYQFAAPHNSVTVNDSAYKDWYCDYYVKMDRVVPENSLVLGGNYGDWGWIGFENPIEVPANTEVPLLGYALGQGDPEVATITYAEVVGFVQTFLCGVAHLDPSLNGATFTVSLRLTDPEDPNHKIDAAVVTYTFDDKPMDPSENEGDPVYGDTDIITYNKDTNGDLYTYLQTLTKGKILVLPAGTYNISGTLLVPDGVTLMAEKAGTVVIHQNSAAQDDVFNCHGDATFINLTIESNHKGYAIDGIITVVDGEKNRHGDGDITVIGCSFKGIAKEKNYGIYKNLNGNLHIEDCTFDGYNATVCGVNNANGTVTVITGCTFTNINGEAVGYVIANAPATFEADVIADNVGLTAENVIGY